MHKAGTSMSGDEGGKGQPNLGCSLSYRGFTDHCPVFIL